MTRDDVMALSGRELDAAVAEHVFQWQRHARYETIGFHGQKVRKCQLCGSEVDWVENDYFCNRHPEFEPPRHSTSWSAMGALIERMTAQCWNVYIEGGYENEFQCGFSRVPDGEINDEDIVWFYAKGCTAAQAVSEIPEAVAKAALLAASGEAKPDA